MTRSSGKKSVNAQPAGQTLADADHPATTLYRALVEQAPAIIYTHAPDDAERLTYISPQVEPALGFSPDQILAKPSVLGARIHPDDRDRLVAAGGRLGGGERQAVEYRLRARNGRWVWFRDIANLVRDEAGRPRHWQGVLIDISREKQAEAELVEAKQVAERANRIRSAFLSIAAMEVQKPLTGIVGYLTLLRDSTADRLSADEQEFVATIMNHVEKLVALVNRYAEIAGQFERAAEIQAQLLPQDTPRVAGYEFAGVCLQARQLGGDFFDWSSGTGTVRITIGDAMGKGVAASLVTATARGLLRSLGHLPVSAAVVAVDRSLASDLTQSDSFITLYYLDLDTATGTLSYVDAGHGLAFIQRREGAVEPLPVSGIPLGVLPGTPYLEGTTELRPGDTLVLYTDGLPDARPDLALDPTAVANAIAGIPGAQAKIDRLVELAGDEETRPDDLTIVVVHRHAAASGRPGRRSRRVVTPETASR